MSADPIDCPERGYPEGGYLEDGYLEGGYLEGGPTALSRVRRMAERARYDKAAVYAVLDAAPFCHVATVRQGRPVVLPMAHARLGDQIVMHGSAAAGLFRDMRRASPVCVTATLFDGLVLGRSARNHSMNYRCATIHGEATAVTEPDQIRAGFRALIEHLTPGRWDEVRQPTEAEIRETGLWQVVIADASVKERSGSSHDPASDLAVPVWAGHLPVRWTYGEPVPAEGLPGSIEPPGYVRALSAPTGRVPGQPAG